MKISIIGLGWLGLPLAKSLAQQGHRILGSTTSPEKHRQLAEEGIDNVLFRLDPHPSGEGFNRLFDADLVVVNVPPKRRSMPETFHPEQIKYLKTLIQQAGIGKVIYTSSTSVYPNVNGEVTESTELCLNSTGHSAVYEAERILWADRNYDLTVIRFGGLLGMDRVPGRYFSGKEQVAGDIPVNYIHQEDAVRLLAHVIDKGLWEETYNGVCPVHPLKRAVYEKNANELGFAPPSSYRAQSDQPDWKRVNAEKIRKTGFEFRYKNPLSFYYTL
ncbi:epimerase [Echinicola soli]|uniref:Epimerase n=1 Tax=Echinicola soli TaxID=2591634 RepID=A0A514CEA1_9BACT|nr:NAD(P)-binding domain-containing protein [Echinicola soli]QDH78152.1 epimerase [Echinicola soli]